MISIVLHRLHHHYIIIIIIIIDDNKKVNNFTICITYELF